MITRLIAAAAVAVSCHCATVQQRTETVAAVLVAEAGGEGLRGMQAVMEVVQVRARSSGKDAFHVVTRRLHFSCLNDTTPAALIAKHKRHPQWATALKLARHGTRTQWARGATHFDHVKLKPGWSLWMRRVAIVGNHAFYRQ